MESKVMVPTQVPHDQPEQRRAEAEATALAPVPASPSGRWLIRSHYWKVWHRRSAEGHACGYTADILQAGVFGEDVARGYHDWPTGGRDEAIPVEWQVEVYEHRADDLMAEALAARAMAASLLAPPELGSADAARDRSAGTNETATNPPRSPLPAPPPSPEGGEA